MYIACPIDNRAPENFCILGLEKWRFLDFEHKFPITSALNPFPAKGFPIDK